MRFRLDENVEHMRIEVRGLEILGAEVRGLEIFGAEVLNVV